jgi:flagellar basal-body rod protein FlgB
MMPGLFSSTTIPVLEQLANFAQQRHQILASNVANVDVPGYRTRDLSMDQFQTQLKQAIEQQNSPGASPASANENLKPFDNVKKSLQTIVYHDENNVGLEQQVAELAKNQLTHNLALTILTSQFRLLEAAISEKV